MYACCQEGSEDLYPAFCFRRVIGGGGGGATARRRDERDGEGGGEYRDRERKKCRRRRGVVKVVQQEQYRSLREEGERCDFRGVVAVAPCYPEFDSRFPQSAPPHPRAQQASTIKQSNKENMRGKEKDKERRDSRPPPHHRTKLPPPLRRARHAPYAPVPELRHERMQHRRDSQPHRREDGKPDCAGQLAMRARRR